MENPKIEFIRQENVHGASQDEIVLGETGQRIKDLNSIQVICEDNDPATGFRAKSSILQGAEDTQGFEIENTGVREVQSGGKEG